jgi:hypothetical protein
LVPASPDADADTAQSVNTDRIVRAAYKKCARGKLIQQAVRYGLRKQCSTVK